jgi:drug/metabolite transporter (DMT)-like permease
LQVTLAGDFSAFLTAVFFCGYIIIGAHLRKWLPIFLYATPVTGFAALLLSIAALVVGEATFSGSGSTGLFGWMTDKAYLPKILYLAVVPGIVGHTGFNALLKWMPALLITLALTIEPLIGTFIGWSVGLAQIPGVWTYSGGAVLLVSTCIVIVAGDRRQQAAAAKESDSTSQKVFFEDASDNCDSTTDIELAEK